MSYSQKFWNDVAWAVESHSFIVHQTRLGILRNIYPDRIDDIEAAALPEDAFMYTGKRDNETIIWTAIVEMAKRNGGAIPTRRELVNMTGLALGTVQTYASETLRPWFVPSPSRPDTLSILGSIYHIPDHVRDRKNLREFLRIVILEDMTESAIYSRLIAYCKKYLLGRAYIGGIDTNLEADSYMIEGYTHRLPTYGGSDEFVLLRALLDHLKAETAVVTDDQRMTLLATGAGLAVFNTAMLEREFSAREASDGN